MENPPMSVPEEQIISHAEAWLVARKEHPEQKHSPEDYIREFNAIASYIDRSREMHPYVRAYFYELLIDAINSLIQGATGSGETRRAAAPEEEDVHHTSRHAGMSRGKK